MIENNKSDIIVENQNINKTKNNNIKEFGTQTDNLYIEFKSFSFIQYFQILFNIDSKDFYKRLVFSFFFFLSKLATEINTNPDIYSTLWIFMCMIFTFTFNSNLKSYFKINQQPKNTNNNSSTNTSVNNNVVPSNPIESVTSSVSNNILKLIYKENTLESKNKTFKPDLALIGKSFLFLFFIGFIVPILLSIILNAMNIFNRRRNIISLYGYSYFIILIGSLISLINVKFLNIVVYIYCIISNILSLLFWIKKEISFNKSKMNLLGYLIIVFTQLGIFFMIWYMYLK